MTADQIIQGVAQHDALVLREFRITVEIIVDTTLDEMIGLDDVHRSMLRRNGVSSLLIFTSQESPEAWVGADEDEFIGWLAVNSAKLFDGADIDLLIPILHELDTASPDKVFRLGDFQISCHGELYHTVIGGDRVLYWSDAVGDEALLMVADVTGHGLLAHLIAGSLHVVFLNVIKRSSLPSAVLKTMHNELYGLMPPAMFLDATLTRLRRSGEVCCHFAGGGSGAFIISSATLAEGGSSEVEHKQEPGGTYLGITDEPDEGWEQPMELALDRQNSLVLATDGLRDMYGNVDGICRAIAEAKPRKKPKRGNAFLRKLVSGRELKDDTTIVVIEALA